MPGTQYRLSAGPTDSVEALAGSAEKKHVLFATSSDDHGPTVDLIPGRKFSQPWSSMKFESRESLKVGPISFSMKARDGSRDHNDFANDALMVTYTAMRGRPAEWKQEEKPNSQLEMILGPKDEGRPHHSDSSSDGNLTDDLTPEVRVTPGQFLKLAEGAQRWDAHQVRDPHNELATATRVRPEGTRDPLGDHYPYYLTHRVKQYDLVTGEEISPLYAVPTDPSLIYTPPGVDERVRVHQDFRDMYGRMAPDAVQGVREYEAMVNGTGADPAGTNELYTATETHRLAGAEYEHFLAIRYQEIAEQEALNQANYEKIGKQRATLLATEEQHIDAVANCGLLHELRAREQRRQQEDLERSVIEDIAKHAQRDERVRQHMRDHVRDVQERMHRALTTGEEYQKQLAANAKHIRHLKTSIEEQCLLLGHCDPEEVRQEAQKLLQVEKERAYAELGRPMDKGKGKEKQQQRKSGVSFCTIGSKRPSPEQTLHESGHAVQELSNAVVLRHRLRHRSPLGAPTRSEWELGL
ncbi:hypothetical protein GGR53DRAFT_524763 [Hypoxylon sp. FL1150]|nr:hypothetical protein GGR53DRAFT_524763 [Hypoxylon sp. FL1150]